MKDALPLFLAVLLVGVIWAGDAAWGGHVIADHTRMMDTYHLSVICEAYGESLAAGNPRFWFPEFAGGHPTHALWMYGFTGPAAAFWAALPLELAYVWSCLASIAFGAVGMRVFLREMRVGSAAALSAGLLFALSEMLFVRTATGGANQVWAIAWAPWVLAGVERAIAGRRRALPALALCAGLAGLAGHVQVWLFLGPVIAAYALVRASGTDAPGRAVGRVTAAAILGLLVASVQVLPTLELMSVADRPASDPQLVHDWSASTGVLAGKVAPGLFGHRPGSYWGGESFDHEQCGYGGAAALLLALLALRRTRARVFWGVVGALGLVLALGARSPLTEWLHALPLLGWARVPARAQMLTLLAGPVLAGLAVDDRLAGRVSGRRFAVAAAATSAAVVVGVWVAQSGMEPLPAVARDVLTAAVATSAGGALVVGGVLWFAAGSDPARRLVPVAVGLAAATTSLPAVQTVASDFLHVDWAARLPAEAQEHRVHLSDFRVPYVERSGLRTFRRPAHVDTRWFAALTDAPNPAIEGWLDIGTILVNPSPGTGPPLRAADTIRVLPARARPAGPGLFYARARGGTSVDALRRGDPSLRVEGHGDQDGGVSPPDRSVRVVRVRPATAVEQEFRLTAPTAGWLFVPEKYYPGWEAEVNAEPTEIRRAGVAFRAVRIPQGEVRAVFRYRPWTLTLGALLSLVTAVGCLLPILRAWRLREPSGRPPGEEA